MKVMWLLAINQMPKLPHVERGLRIGGEGPIYGPRYTRAKSRVGALFMIGAIACGLLLATSGATPSMAWRLVLFMFVAVVSLMAWGITWRLHLARKWKRQQSAEGGLIWGFAPPPGCAVSRV